MRNKVIKLITEYGPLKDKDGFEIERKQHIVECFASLKTSTYKEFYEASRIGEQVTDVFVVGADDYNLSMYVDEKGKKMRPTKIECEGLLYRIVRRFERVSADYTVELSCSEVE